MKRIMTGLVSFFLFTAAMSLGTIGVSAEESYLRYGDVKRILLKSENSVAEVFVSSEGASLPYRLYVPDDYDPTKSYPLVLFFHGAGERGTDNNHLFLGGSILQRLLMSSEQEKHPCLILAPQCPVDSQWVLSDWGPGTYDHQKIQPSPYMTAAEELLEQVIADYSVDEKALYVSGLSMGGYGTWDLISRHPDRFAAAIPVCGGIDERYMEGLKGFPIRTFHAADDPVVSCVGTRKANELLKDHGDFLYTEYPTGGHLIWDTAYATADLMDWLFAQRLGGPIESETETVPESETDAQTETAPAATDSETQAQTAPETAPQAGNDSAGCASILGFSAVSAIALLGGGLLLRRKRYT